MIPENYFQQFDGQILSILLPWLILVKQENPDDFGLTELISYPCNWEYDKDYKIVLKSGKNEITL